jgi:hypothetical protein
MNFKDSKFQIPKIPNSKNSRFQKFQILRLEFEIFGIWNPRGSAYKEKTASRAERGMRFSSKSTILIFCKFWLFLNCM